LAQDTGAQHDFAFAIHRLRRIARNIEHGLNQLLAIADQSGRLVS
jgi:hypothetical protein